MKDDPRRAILGASINSRPPDLKLLFRRRALVNSIICRPIRAILWSRRIWGWRLAWSKWKLSRKRGLSWRTPWNSPSTWFSKTCCAPNNPRIVFRPIIRMLRPQGPTWHWSDRPTLSTAILLCQVSTTKTTDTFPKSRVLGSNNRLEKKQIQRPVHSRSKRRNST